MSTSNKKAGRNRSRRTAASTTASAGALTLKQGSAAPDRAEEQVHKHGKSMIVCTTDKRVLPRKEKSMLELVVDASEGFIPLWEKGLFLRWRFHEASMNHFEDPEAAKAEIRKLLAEALAAWGDAAPIRFSESTDASDFQIVMSPAASCSAQGCTLASAFFPDSGRHKLMLYPTLFEENRSEQVETLVHELGHVFGLRHFFADVSEKKWPSEIFGKHQPFSIMNYGAQSKLTSTDKADLKRMYAGVWSGALQEINGTRIVQVKPYHYLGNP